MTKTKTEARRELAKVYLHDADYAGQSWYSRTQAALDAAYLLALVLLGEQKADIYEHPAPGALVSTTTVVRPPGTDRLVFARLHVHKRLKECLAESTSGD